MYQMSIDDLVSGKVKPKKSTHPSGEYVTYHCPICDSFLGMVELDTGEFITKRDCPHGHDIDWNVRRLHDGITGISDR